LIEINGTLFHHAYFTRTRTDSLILDYFNYTFYFLFYLNHCKSCVLYDDDDNDDDLKVTWRSNDCD